MLRVRLRAFTLIEVVICITLLAVVAVPFLTMVDKVRKSYHHGIRLNDLKTEVDRVGFHLLGVLRGNHPMRIAADNRSLTFGKGGKVQWSGTDLWIDKGPRRYRLSQEVSHFSIHKRAGLTYLVLEIQEPRSKGTRRKIFVVEEDGYATRL